jgi:hypothetical protein
LSRQGPKPLHELARIPFVVSDQKGRLLYKKDIEGVEYILSTNIFNYEYI